MHEEVPVKLEKTIMGPNTTLFLHTQSLYIIVFVCTLEVRILTFFPPSCEKKKKKTSWKIMI